MTPGEKIELFHSLFRGRNDVFAVRWESPRGKGYKPVRAPFGPEVIQGHLLGKAVVGVYPLLPDNTTWFLAIDCDGALAGRDAQALVEQCRARELPVALERSRSGQGFHLWFFFESPIAAAKARAFGSHLVRSAAIELQSLDRFFPSQDCHTGPKGLGNLIALPLQKEVRGQDNSVFVDPVSLQAFPSQWSFFKGVQKLSEEALGLVLSEPSDVLYAPLPLLKLARPSAGASEPGPVSGPVEITLAEHIEVSLPGSASLLSFLRSVSQFHNPEWFRKQQRGQYLGETPRFIRCGGKVGDVWVLSRGLWGEFRDFLEETKTDYTVSDGRTSPEPLAGWTNEYRLRPDQLQIVHQILSSKSDVVLEAPTGTGKTVVALEMLVRRGVPALILVSSRALLDQWLERLETAMKLPKSLVGLVRQGKLTLGERVTVATLQSLFRRELKELANHCGHVIVDECHRAPAKTFAAVLRQLKPRYFLGLTATPRRKDQLQRLIFAYLGQRVKSSSPKELDRQSIIILPRLTCHQTDLEHPGDEPIQKLLGVVCRDSARNHRIAEDIVQSVEEGHLVLVLSDRKEQCDLLHEVLKEKVGAAVIYGRVGKKARKKIFTEFEQGTVRVLISTARLLGEGWDCPPLSALFLPFPMGDSPRLEQLIGRLTRPHPDKPAPVVHDYVDHKVPVLSAMFQRRLKVFRRLLGEEKLPAELQNKTRKQRADIHYKPVRRRKTRANRVQETGQLFLFE